MLEDRLLGTLRDELTSYDYLVFLLGAAKEDDSPIAIDHPSQPLFQLWFIASYFLYRGQYYRWCLSYALHDALPVKEKLAAAQALQPQLFFLPLLILSDKNILFFYILLFLFFLGLFPLLCRTMGYASYQLFGGRLIIRVDEISECLDDFLDIGTNLLRGVGVFLELEVEGGSQLGRRGS